MPAPPQLAFLNAGKRNGEFSVAYDPRAVAQQAGNTNYVYAAAQELTLGDPTVPSCIIAKKTVVYVSADGGQTWTLAPGNADLPGANNPGAAFDRARLAQNQVWATDQTIRVASDGTVYLTILDDSPYASCQDLTILERTAFNRIELFTSAPGAGHFTGVVVVDDSEGTTNSNGTREFFDLPQLAVSPADPNLAVIFYSGNFVSPTVLALRTVQRTASGMIVSQPQTNLGLASESALAFDEAGLLYVVGSDLSVKQFRRRPAGVRRLRFLGRRTASRS